MGVRLLQTYIKQYVRDGVLSIDIREEVEKFKRQNNGTEPLIVIDLLTLHTLFYANAHEIILGGRYNLYIERALDLLGRIKSLGVHLVFFADGPMKQEKLATCLQRRDEGYSKGLEALHAVYDGLDLSTCTRDDELGGRSAFFGDLRELAKRFGSVHTSYRNECDLEIAEYATRNRAMAIISQDTDFLIFEGDWRYWSARDLNVATLCTTEFNRWALRQTLGLHSDQMAIFATMSGNDYLPYDSVRNFHKRIKHRNDHWHFGAIAHQIRSDRLSMATMSEKDRRTIARQIFNRHEQNAGLELIRNSLQSYDYTQMRTVDIEHLPIPFHGDLDKIIYPILADSSYIVTLDRFDLSKTDFMPFHDLVMPLIRRMMGILLKNDTNGPTSRTFCFKRDPKVPYEEVILQPDFPSDDVPPLKSLLFDPMESPLSSTRIRLLSWILSTDLVTKIMELPFANVANVATILHLMQLQQIRIDEADCLLLACNCSKQVYDSLCLNDMKRIDERDCRLAYLFVSLRSYVKSCMKVVGLTDPTAMLTFDGLYFHNLRKLWCTISDHDRETLLRPYDDLRIYAR